MKPTQRPLSTANLHITPWRLFVYAQAFRFSSGHGKCFSPGFKALLVWYTQRLKLYVVNRSLARRWRMRFERE